MIIKLINISEYLNGTNFYSAYHISTAMYYRFFIPKILSKYDKILYLDCDIIVNGSILNLFEQDLSNDLLGAVSEIDFSNPQYFNSGVLVFNVKQFLEENICEKLIDYVNKNQNLNLPDQDALNFICKNRITYFSRIYNYYVTPAFRESSVIKQLKIRNYAKIKILHYTQKEKPWIYCKLTFANKWWKTLKHSPSNIQKAVHEKYDSLLKYTKPFSRYYLFYSLFGAKISDFFISIRRRQK